jgi:hypothetical protein
LVTEGTEEEYENLTRIHLLDQRLNDIVRFLGKEELYAYQTNDGNILKEVSHWYKIASILDKNGLNELEAKLQFLDRELDNITKEKRMNHLTKEQKEEVS